MGTPRVGVQLMVPSPQHEIIDGLRRALADTRLARDTPAHCTLLPPQALTEDKLPVALGQLWRTTGRSARVDVRLGAPAFFRDHGFLYLPLEDGRASVEELYARVCVPPFRGNPWPFFPHVTLAEDVEESTAEAAITALGGFALDVRFDALVIRSTSGDDRDPEDWRDTARFMLAAW